MGKKVVPGISQCMIVRNEEENIECALTWGKGIVSEQIVVDTGSSDRTVEIARKMGAKIYEFPWINDFSAAKNYAISMASHEWIAFLDADEYFPYEDAQRLSVCLAQVSIESYDGIITAFIDLDNDGKILEVGSHLRIFRNIPGLRYYRRIHECLKKEGNQVFQVVDMTDQLSICHTGYGKAEKKKKEGSQRNISMILNELRENPDDYEMYGYLGNEYAGMGKLDQAESSYQKAISLMPPDRKGVYGVTSSEIPRRLLNILTLMPEKRETDLLDIYRLARDRWPEDGDYDYIMGQYYGSRGNYHAGERHLNQALGLLEKYGYLSKSALLSGNILKAYEMLAMCCFNNGKLADCVQITARMLKQDPYLMSSLVVMLSAFLKDPGTGGRGRDGAVETVAFLGNNFYQLQSLKDRLFILQAALSAGYEELLKVLKETFTIEEFNAVDQALGGRLSRPVSQSPPSQLMSVFTAIPKKRDGDLFRITLFYCPTDSFNFFADQLDRELQARGHETFILDLRNPAPEDPHSYTQFARFASSGIDAAICYDAMCIRDQALIDIWNKGKTVVMDMFMDPPLRFHPSLGNPPERYHLFCCDREHVEYVRQYFGKEVPKVDFMPHVGVIPGSGHRVIPYDKREYDILFCGTYYRPEKQMEEITNFYPRDGLELHLYQEALEILKGNSGLSVVQGILLAINQKGLNLSEGALKSILNISNYVDWAIRCWYWEHT